VRWTSHCKEGSRFLIGTKGAKEHLNNPETYQKQGCAKERLEDRVEAFSEHSR
jgi:hypothetical protein